MMLQTKSPRCHSLKLLALLPIVGITLALNAETVTDVVYKNDEPQRQVPVKKGKKTAAIKTGSGQAIQVIPDKSLPKSDDEEMARPAEYAGKPEAEPNAAVIILNARQAGEEPLLIVDGKIATADQVRALPRDSVAKVATMREKAAVRSYGEKARNGALVITTVRHQEEKDNEPPQPDVSDEEDDMPQFPGGFGGLMQYLSSNLRYPKDAKEAGTQGSVVVSFFVEEDGSISNASVTKPTYSSLDEEALRVISTMPKWTPGKHNGKAVRMKYSLPVSFRLDRKETPKAESDVALDVRDYPEETEQSGFPIENNILKEAIERLPGAEIDKDGNITVNGKEVKRILFDGSDNQLAVPVMNIIINDAEHFDYVIDGEPVTVKELREKKSKDSIKSIEYVKKDSEHPKDRLLISTKKAE